MGLDVSPLRQISITDAHERKLNTRRGGTCYRFQAGQGITAWGVFRRTLVGDDRDDGIPLVNALKSRNGFTIDTRNLAELRRRARATMSRQVTPGTYDFVVPAPSSSGVPAYLARYMARHLGAGMLDVLRKPTIGAALAGAPPLHRVKGADRKQVKTALGVLGKQSQNLEISVKGIPARARPYFTVVEAVASPALAPGSRILVVDDSAATGTTLRDSILALRRAFQPVSVVGLALVGPA